MPTFRLRTWASDACAAPRWVERKSLRAGQATGRYHTGYTHPAACPAHGQTVSRQQTRQGMVDPSLCLMLSALLFCWHLLLTQALHTSPPSPLYLLATSHLHTTHTHTLPRLTAPRRAASLTKHQNTILARHLLKTMVAQRGRGRGAFGRRARHTAGQTTMAACLQ